MKRLRIETPASSANLGPGFDALAMTLDIVDIIHFEPDPDLDGPVLEEVTGEEAVPLDPHDNLLCKAYVAAGALIETPLPGARFRLESNIPVGKGLGSSAAAVAAGIAAARASIEVKPDIQAFLQLGAALEGHADNVSAALLGGLVTAYTDAAATHALRVASYLSLGIALFIPDCPVLTKESRQALPATVTLREAAQSIGRATYLTTALMWGRWDLLSTGMQDILHQPHRSKALRPPPERAAP